MKSFSNRVTVNDRFLIISFLFPFFSVIASLLNQPQAWFWVAVLYASIAGYYFRQLKRPFLVWALGWGYAAMGMVCLTWFFPFSASTELFLFKAVIDGVALLIALWWVQVYGRVALIFMLPWLIESTKLLLLRDLLPPLADYAWLVLMTAVLFHIALGLTFAQTSPAISRRWVWLIGIISGLTMVGVTAPVLASYLIFYRTLPFVLLPFPLFWLIYQAIGAWQEGKRGRTAVFATLSLIILIFLNRVWWQNQQSFFTIHQEAVTNDAPVRLIVDTDLSYDDVAALLYLLNKPEVEIIGVTTVHGIAHADVAVENVQRLFSLADREEIPVQLGADVPLQRERAFPFFDRYLMELLFRPSYPLFRGETPSTTAVEFILQEADGATFVALGPLTNLAQAMEQDAALDERLTAVWISAGAISRFDFEANYQDWNLWLDPEANEIVFQSKLPRLLVPLDVTHFQLAPSGELVQKVAEEAPNTPAMRMLLQLLQIIRLSGVRQPLWDLTAVAIFLNPQICTDWQQLPLTIQFGEESKAGFVQIDETAPTMSQVCMEGEQALYDAELLQTFGGSP